MFVKSPLLGSETSKNNLKRIGRLLHASISCDKVVKLVVVEVSQ